MGKEAGPSNGVIRLKNCRRLKFNVTGPTDKGDPGEWENIRVIINENHKVSRTLVRLSNDGQLLKSDEKGDFDDLTRYWMTPLTSVEGKWYCEIKPYKTYSATKKSVDHVDEIEFLGLFAEKKDERCVTKELGE